MQTKSLREYRRVNPDILPEVGVSFLGVHRRALAGVKHRLRHVMTLAGIVSAEMAIARTRTKPTPNTNNATNTFAMLLR